MMSNILLITCSFNDLIDCFLETKSKYYYICDHQNRLIGVISQSDILTSVLSNNYAIRIYDLLNPNFICWNVDRESSPPKEKMYSERLIECPKVNNDGNLLGVYSVFNTLE